GGDNRRGGAAGDTGRTPIHQSGADDSAWLLAGAGDLWTGLRLLALQARRLRAVSHGGWPGRGRIRSCLWGRGGGWAAWLLRAETGEAVCRRQVRARPGRASGGAFGNETRRRAESAAAQVWATTQIRPATSVSTT